MTGKCVFEGCDQDARDPWAPILIGCGCGECNGSTDHGGGELHIATEEEYCNLHALVDHLQTPRA